MLPEELRADVMMRIATLDGIQPSALTELDDIMEKQFAGKPGGGKTSVLGRRQGRGGHHEPLEPSQEGAIMEQIRKADEALGGRSRI